MTRTEQFSANLALALAAVETVPPASRRAVRVCSLRGAHGVSVQVTPEHFRERFRHEVVEVSYTESRHLRYVDAGGVTWTAVEDWVAP